ncbi:MAG: hypothetical protein WCP70_15450 [Methanothrix sp.]
MQTLRLKPYLRRSLVIDPQDRTDRLQLRLRRLTGDIGPAWKHFQAVLVAEEQPGKEGKSR